MATNRNRNSYFYSLYQHSNLPMETTPQQSDTHRNSLQRFLLP